MTTDFKNERKSGIGGTDIAAIVGVSKWRTPLDVWREKVMGSEDAESAPMHWGKLLEPAIRREAGKQLRKKVRGPQFVRDGIRIGHLDGLVGEDVLEIKTARSGDDWGEPGTDDIPQAYEAQVQWYLGITGRPMAHVAVLIAGSDFRLYHLEPNQKMIAGMQAIAEDFWQNNVLAQVPPPPKTLDDAKQIWRSSIAGKVRDGTPAALTAMEELEALKRQAKSLDEEIAGKQLIIRCALEDAEALVDADGNPLCTLKSQKVSEYLVPAREQRVMRFTTHWTKRSKAS